MKTLNHTKLKLSSLVIGMTLCMPAGAVSISSVPLFVSASVDPNVMLLIDTSGSMNNIVWASGFDPTANYTDWSDGDNNYRAASGNNHLHSIDVTHNGSNNCGSSGRWVRGDAGGVTKFLCVPANSVVGTETRYSGKYLNYLFDTYADDTDLTAIIPTDIRMEVAKKAARDLVDNTTGVRFGTSSFYGPSSQSWGHGATIDAGCGSSTATVKSKINGYTASTNTPLAESLYEITRYFRGMSSYYHSNTGYTSPIQYRCQHNFTIAITDGLPTRDINIPTNDPDDTADASAALPDWDNNTGVDASGNPIVTTQAMYPNFPKYSDGFQPAGDEGNEAFALYLDDIAKFGYDIDFKTSGTDLAGGSYQDPDFPKQNMETYTIGFSINMQMLQDAAEYGNGLYFTADNATQLTSALQKAIDDAKFKGEAAAAAVATNSTRLDTNTTIYQARFDSRDWSGDLLAFSLDATTGDVNTTPDWSAAALLPPAATATVTAASRKIYTFDSSDADPANHTGIDFVWPADYTNRTANSDLNDAMVQALLANAPYAWNTTNAAEQAANQTYGDELVDYLRGDTSASGTYNGAWRTRKTVLGDIVNSNPAFVGTRDFGFKQLPGTEGTSYTSFRDSPTYKTRQPVVYVGANDGMLHAFNATTGKEMFAYVPTSVMADLDKLTDPNYLHRFFVNGSPRASDAYLNSTWRTVLVGAPGAGGRSVFALDITYPSSFTASSVLWELTSDDDSDLGYVLGQPTVARMNDGSWVALVGNGYNSANDRAVLFIIDLASGAVLHKIDTQVGSSGSPNGLSAPVPVDLDGDRITDVIYAGDLLGNMWKFDVSKSTKSTWKSAYLSSGKPAPLFTATDASGNVQPITVRPAVGAHPKGGTMVYFGTGTFFQTGDNTISATPPVQSFYALRDDDAVITGRGELQSQTIDYEVYNVTIGTDSYDLRVVSDNTVNYSTQNGWYLDLESPVNGAEGERVVVDPLLRNGRMIFSTLIPNTDPCGYGGAGWLMEIDAINGGRFAYSVFDLNGDGEFNAQDFVSIANTGDLPVSGRRYGEIISQPVVIDAGEKEHKYVSGSSGSIQHIVERGANNKGRQSWRQIR
ncbi:MAG TPA: hypothetical protein ENK12_02825 [Gammaproteobacteria bacterium]|nr:hypothetical protein [Gammaproteobacteria bacterium]